MLNELIFKLNTCGANFVKVVDISMLSANENQGYSVAILIGIALSPSYVFRLSKEKLDWKKQFVNYPGIRKCIVYV